MNDVTVEKESPAMEQNVNTDAVVANDDTSVDAVSEVDGGAEEKADLTPEQKLEEVSRQAESLEQKVKRQTASYNALQKKLQEERQLREQLQVKAPVEELVEPKLEDFDTLDEYRQADREYVRKSAEKEFKEKIEKDQAQFKAAQVQAERMKVLEASKAAMIEINPNYVQAEAEVNQYLQVAAQSVPAATQDAIAEALYSEGNVAGVINYFGENNGSRLEELTAISQMSPIKAAIEVYKVHQKINGSPASKKTQTKPAPPKSVKPKGGKVKDLRSGSVLKGLGIKK